MIKFVLSHYEYWDQKLVTIIQTATSSFVLAGIYGGIMKTRTTFIRFIENNEATMFRSHIDAKRKLSDKMTLSFMSGFARYGAKLCFFCTTFV